MPQLVIRMQSHANSTLMQAGDTIDIFPDEKVFWHDGELWPLHLVVKIGGTMEDARRNYLSDFETAEGLHRKRRLNTVAIPQTVLDQVATSKTMVLIDVAAEDFSITPGAMAFL